MPEQDLLSEGDSTGLQPSLDSKRGFCLSQYQPQLQKSLPRLEKKISRIMYWLAHQTRVNMASGMSTTAPSMAITAQSTAPSTAPLQVAGPSTMEPAVPIGEQVGQDTPSVIQGARPEVRIEQTAQPPQMYGAQPYISGQQYTAPLPCTHPSRMVLLTHVCACYVS